MDKNDIWLWLIKNLFIILSAVISLLNLWSLSKLLPIESNIRANAVDIQDNQEIIIELKQTTIKLMENISSIRADVSFIRGKIE